MLIVSRESGLVCGIDEAGRGPLAGPVCAAAVILPKEFYDADLNDSKKLSEKKRERLYAVITQNAVAWSVAFASVEEIERLNILRATFLAMNRAYAGLNTPVEKALVDGNQNPGLPVQTECIVGGDGKYDCIAAASVLAKVSRDRLMCELGESYPQYGFQKHKGYATKQHREAIAHFGPCEFHRLSFLGNILR